MCVYLYNIQFLGTFTHKVTSYFGANFFFIESHIWPPIDIHRKNSTCSLHMFNVYYRMPSVRGAPLTTHLEIFWLTRIPHGRLTGYMKTGPRDRKEAEKRPHENNYVVCDKRLSRASQWVTPTGGGNS